MKNTRNPYLWAPLALTATTALFLGLARDENGYAALTANTVISSVIGEAAAYTSNCIGEACDDLKFSFENGCHTVVNTGSRAIDVSMGPYSFKLEPGESNIYAPLGECPEFRGGQDRATYSKD